MSKKKFKKIKLELIRNTRSAVITERLRAIIFYSSIEITLRCTVMMETKSHCVLLYRAKCPRALAHRFFDLDSVLGFEFVYYGSNENGEKKRHGTFDTRGNDLFGTT